MASLFTPFQQFFDGNGDPLAAGTLSFFNQGTTSVKQDTFSDASLTNPNANPVVLDGEGRLPNIIFGSGVYKVFLRSAPTSISPNGVLIDELDPVGGDSGSVVAFSDWISTTIYNKEAIVTGSDGHFYQTIGDSNLGNDPTLDPGTNAFWKEVRFIGMFNTMVTYDQGEIVQTVDGLLWASVVAANLNNDPATDDGTNWIPAVDGSKVSTSTSESTFFAFADERTRNNAGMGFSEWGLSNSNNELVNDGIYCDPTISNGGLYFGYDDFATETGISRTKHPIVNAMGIELILQSVAVTTPDILNSISLPPASNGTKTYDSSTGDVVQHASVTDAFATETANNKVIISRKDTVFIEVWAEKINDLDVVYPLGNVQNAETDYEGITLATNGIDQGYSAFGEWDTTTTGNNAVWSSLTPAEKTLFTEEPNNNIYGDIQIRYRIRVVEGVSDTISTPIDAQNSAWFNGGEFFRPRGKIVTPVVDLSHVTSEGFIGTVDNGIVFTPIDGSNLGEAYCSKVPITNPWPGSDDFALDGFISEIPICYVQRRNQGAYEPTFNPNGTDKFSGDVFWYVAGIGSRDTTEKCFVNANGDGSISSANSGRDDGKFFDSTQGSDIEDLRMSTKLLPHLELLEKYFCMSKDGKVRGFESVPFTKMYIQLNSVNATVEPTKNIQFGLDMSHLRIGDPIGYKQSTGIYCACSITAVLAVDIFTVARVDGIDITGRTMDSDALLAFEYQNHFQANPSWTDIIGDPERIFATLPDGVEGQWIPLIPDATLQTWNLNRKSFSASVSSELTIDDGAVWSTDSRVISSTPNSYDLAQNALIVRLDHYNTQAHFTKDNINSKVLSLGDVFAVNDKNISDGNLLLSSLIGKVGIGNTVPRNLQFNLTSKGSIQSGILSEITGNEPTHPTLALGDNTNPAVKTLSYLSDENGTSNFVMIYKEMTFDFTKDSSADAGTITAGSPFVAAVGDLFRLRSFSNNQFNDIYIQFKVATSTTWASGFFDQFYILNDVIHDTSGVWSLAKLWNGNGWGDNNQFEITDNQSTNTDDNDNTVIFGTASFNTQYFIVEN